MFPANDYLDALHRKARRKRNKDEEEMKKQMRENFGKSMAESVYATRKFMARMPPSTARRMVSTAEKSLNHFCRTYFPPHIRLGTQPHPTVTPDSPTTQTPFKVRLFNINHLEQHLRKTENIRKSGSEQGALLNKLPLSQRRTVRGGNTMSYRKDYENKQQLWSVVSEKGGEEYAGKRKRERNKSLFNLVMR